MTDRSRLPEARIREALQKLPEWELRGDRLHREYRFLDFTEAWVFMSGCALHAQSMNHHPNWSNVYSQVIIDLFTHDAGGVTALDLDLAGRFEDLARRLAREG
jgi:4a-hydroxytetrahydrobiopterin dehydratase